MKPLISLFKLIAILTSSLPSIGLAQSAFELEVISSAGMVFEDGEVHLSWTLGETFTEVLTSDEIQLTQGFQQAFDERITTTSEIPNYLGLHLPIRIEIGPNPTNGFVNLRSNSNLPMNTQIFNLTGELIFEVKWQNSKRVYLSGLPMSIYLFKISDQTGYSQMFKISLIN